MGIQHKRPTTVSRPFEFPFDHKTWLAVSAELGLSPQLERVVELLLIGKRDKQIARELRIAVPTVRTYLSRIFLQVGAADRVEVVLRVVAVAWKLSSTRIRNCDVVVTDDTDLNVSGIDVASTPIRAAYWNR